MKFKLICCEVFMRMACFAIAGSPHTVDPEFTPLRAHEDADRLREDIQHRIDAAGRHGGYDAILLGMGLCGNATAGLKAGSVPLVMPRAHDCCTIFLGHRNKFLEYFKEDLSSQWSSHGYMERETAYLRETETGKFLGLDKDYQELVDQYGEENARFIWETLHPQTHSSELIYISVPGFEHLGTFDKLKAFAQEQEKSVRLLEGDMRLVRNLLNGDWDEEEYLVVPPGKEIKAVYDHDRVVTSE